MHREPADGDWKRNLNEAKAGARTGEIPLEAVPNISEGADEATLGAISRAFGSRGCNLLDVHSDPDYGRSVFTIVGSPQELADALVAGAREAIARLNIRTYRGAHPCIGVLDVVPIVYLSREAREHARDEARAVANRLAGELSVPIFLYGELATSEERRERAYFREGGPDVPQERIASGELEPDFGPSFVHPTAGATLVAARPLVAFNLELSGADVEAARAIAARVRERGGGLPGVRAIGVELQRRGSVQISMNVHDPFQLPLKTLVRAVRSEAEQDGAEIVAGHLVGLAPAAALDGLADEVPLPDFDPARHVLENRLRSASR